MMFLFILHERFSSSRRFAKRFAVAFLGLLAIGNLVATGAEPVDSSEEQLVSWETNVEEALADAADQEKNVLLRFTADWCPPCRVMDASVWPEAEVQSALAENTIPVMVNIDKASSRAMVFRYGIRVVPTLIIVEPDGTEIRRNHFMSAPELVEFLREEQN